MIFMICLHFLVPSDATIWLAVILEFKSRSYRNPITRSARVDLKISWLDDIFNYGLSLGNITYLASSASCSKGRVKKSISLSVETTPSKFLFRLVVISSCFDGFWGSGSERCPARSGTRILGRANVYCAITRRVAKSSTIGSSNNFLVIIDQTWAISISVISGRVTSRTTAATLFPTGTRSDT